jgi:HSP20 family protein
MTEKKNQVKEKGTSEKAEIAVTKKKQTPISKPSRKKATLAPASTSDVWQAFDDTFARFRSDFEDIFFPAANWAKTFSFFPEVRVPAVDLKDGEKEYTINAEMPGFKKEDIELEVTEDSIAITGTAGWKYDEKGQLYICKERACKTFYRRIELPEPVKIHEVNANLAEGVLKITLPKKTPQQKRKIIPK